MKRATHKDLERVIDAMGLGSGKDFSNLFDEFLEMSLGLLCNNPSTRQQELLRSTFADAEKKELFFEAFKAYGDACEGYRDPLGDMFMERISHGHNGQYFTPDDLCKLMAELTKPVGGSINDPCCGSGRTLLAGLEYSRKEGVEPEIYGNDISYTAAKMCLMNLLYNSARGAVSCGDTLRLDLSTFRFYKIDRVLMPDGRWISTYWRYTHSDLAEVNEKRKKWLMDMAANGLLVELDSDNEKETKANKKQVKKMTPENFFKMVTEMRNAQRDYENTASEKSLTKKKALEKVIDLEIKKYENE